MKKLNYDSNSLTKSCFEKQQKMSQKSLILSTVNPKVKIYTIK